MEQVVLVDEKNNKQGTKEKLQAHKDGDLHRAFSVFIFDSNDKLLLQQRAMGKYHSAGLWSNTCCSHPRENEGIVKAGQRRLGEELGIDSPDLVKLFSFQYEVSLENEISEHELDHVLVGRKDEFNIDPDPEEVRDWDWKSISKIKQEINSNPDKFTYWFKVIMRDHLDELKNFLAES